MLVKITSAGNSRTKLVRKLQTKKGRIEEGRFVAEGRNLITEILERGLEVDFIMVPASLLSESRSGTEDMIASCIDSPDITLCAVPDREFEKLTDACGGVGMLAVVRMKEYGPETVRDLPPEANILILDRIQDPGNLGCRRIRSGARDERNCGSMVAESPQIHGRHGVRHTVHSCEGS